MHKLMREIQQSVIDARERLHDSRIGVCVEDGKYHVVFVDIGPRRKTVVTPVSGPFAAGDIVNAVRSLQ